MADRNTGIRASQIKNLTLLPEDLKSTNSLGAGLDNYLPSYDHATGQFTWVAQGGGAGQLSDLSDVGDTTPTDKNVLVADGDSWESRALVEADISDLGTYLENLIEDTTPQLGGDLDMNGFSIGGNSEADLDDAVAKKHTQNSDTDLDATFEATFVKKADNVNVLADISSAGADIEDAVTKKHTHSNQAQLDLVSDGDHDAISSGNPHSVTKSNVSLGSVENYGIASQAEAEAGSSNVKYMTPLRVSQAIDALAGGGGAWELVESKNLSGAGGLGTPVTFSSLDGDTDRMYMLVWSGTQNYVTTPPYFGIYLNGVFQSYIMNFDHSQDVDSMAIIYFSVGGGDNKNPWKGEVWMSGASANKSGSTFANYATATNITSIGVYGYQATWTGRLNLYKLKW